MPTPPMSLTNNPLVVHGKISYNHVNFPANSKISFRTRYLYDSSGRTIVACVYTITVDCHIDANSTSLDVSGNPLPYNTETMMAALRQNLATPGGELHLDQIGWGAFGLGTTYGGVNVGAYQSDPTQPARDILWGPKPKELLFQKIGGSSAARLIWQVEIALPECDNAEYVFAFMEVNWSVTYSIDFSGYSRMKVSGHYRIPQTRNNGARTLMDNADSVNYREVIVASFPCPDRFRPGPAQFDLSEDKCEERFSLEYLELPVNILPPGIIEANVSHRFSNPRGSVGVLWFGVLSGTYEVARDKDRVIAYTYFQQLVQDRLNAALANAVDNESKTGTVLLQKMDVNEDEIYGTKTASFSVSYMITCKIDQFITASALWTAPTYGNDYQGWVQSMQGTIFAPGARGFAGLQFDEQSDLIVDLCNQTPQTPSTPTNPAPVQGSTGMTLKNTYPEPESSWIDYVNKIKVHKLESAVECKPIPQVGSEGYAPVTPSNPTPMRDANSDDLAVRSILDTASGGGSVIAAQYPFATQPTSSIQYRAAPTVSVIMEGSAIRAGFTIDPPQITTAAGAPLQPNDDEESYFQWWVGDSWFDIPIIFCRWRIRYLLTKFPSADFKVPPNPLDQRVH